MREKVWKDAKLMLWPFYWIWLHPPPLTSASLGSKEWRKKESERDKDGGGERGIYWSQICRKCHELGFLRNTFLRCNDRTFACGYKISFFLILWIFLERGRIAFLNDEKNLKINPKSEVNSHFLAKCGILGLLIQIRIQVQDPDPYKYPQPCAWQVNMWHLSPL